MLQCFITQFKLTLYNTHHRRQSQPNRQTDKSTNKQLPFGVSVNFKACKKRHIPKTGGRKTQKASGQNNSDCLDNKRTVEVN